MIIFNKEDFELSMEKSLHLRMISDEINQIKGEDNLRKELILQVENLLRTQQLLTIAIQKTLLP